MIQRIQKILADAGLASRREAERWIVSGRVTVDGIPAVLGQKADQEHQRICVDGKAVAVPPSAHSYILLYKPKGCISAVRDDRGRTTAADLVAGAGRRLFPVGRLDYNSEGLLLMTDDGALAYALTHPSHEIEKVYLVTAAGAPLDRALEVLRSPLCIDGRPIRPACVEPLGREGGGWLLRFTIHEGRNRQIRKMCQAAGMEVLRLCRVAEGPLTLGTLVPGQWRVLTEEEQKKLTAFLKN